MFKKVKQSPAVVDCVNAALPAVQTTKKGSGLHNINTKNFILRLDFYIFNSYYI